MPVQNFTIQSNAVTLRFYSGANYFEHPGERFNISWAAISNPPKEKSDNFIG